MIKVGVIGAGNRGKDTYAKYILNCTDEAKIVAVAEPNPLKRKEMMETYLKVKA
jgi:predicted dehydrogenase